MKLRSLVLLSCMLLVPSLAMFSHLIPPEFRAATRRRFASMTSSWVNGSDSHAAVARAAEPVASPPATFPAQPPSEPPGAGLSPAAAGGPPAVSSGLASSGTMPPAAAEPTPPPQVAQLADRTRQVRDQQARDQQVIEKQLKALGAVSFDCQPQAGPGGLSSCSCRVPVDTTGQLQRVFQATGHDPGSAAAALLDQVLAWRQRAAVQPPGAASGGVDGLGALPSDRFR